MSTNKTPNHYNSHKKSSEMEETSNLKIHHNPNHINNSIHVSSESLGKANKALLSSDSLDKGRRLTSAFDMNLQHNSYCKKLQASAETSESDLSSLSLKDLQVLKDGVFTSIANTQLQSIISPSQKTTPNHTNVTPPTKPTKTETTTNKSPNNAKSIHINTLHKSGSFTFNNEQLVGIEKGLTKMKKNFGSMFNLTINKIFDSETNRKFDAYFNRNTSFVNLSMLNDDNQKWKHVVKRVEPYLDVYSILMLRQTCKSLYYYKYKLRSHGTLSFRGFAGFDTKWIFDTILPLIHHVLDLPENCKIRFDFTGCVLIKDISIVYLLRSNAINTNMEMKQYARNVKELIFDFCHQITDKGLEVMLSTKLPYLQRLSLTCCRNEHFTGLPFIRELNSHNWPKLTKFRCTFSNIMMEPLQAIADFICKNSGLFEKVKLNEVKKQQITAHNQSVFDLTMLINDSMAKETKSDLEEVEFDIYGSWGSRRLLAKLGFGIYCTTFTSALKNNNYTMCSKLTKKIQTQFFNLSEQPNMKKNACLILLKNRGSELLVNSPIAVKDRSHNNVGIWTLPIILVIQQSNMELFMLLIKRGARLNIWDSMKKSPLLIACEMSQMNFVEKILKFPHPPMPYDNIRNIPIIVAIANANVELVKLLLSDNFEINFKCPSIKNYKSPLYVAAEYYNKEIIKLLLEYGADPNWKYRHRSTPTLLGYQQDPKILETFLDYGAGESIDKRWVLVQVLACAILKNDDDTVELLVTNFPDLVEKEHEIWSKPMVAVSKLNRLSILNILLKQKADVNTFDSFGTTPLHASCEEPNIEIVKLLLENSAKMDVQDVFGRTPLHLAVLENNTEVVSLLLEKGAKVDIKEYSYGETPLMTAMRTRNENMASILMKTGKYDLKTTDYNGRNLNYYIQFYKMNNVELAAGSQAQTTR